MIDLTADDLVFLAEPHEYKVSGVRVPSVTQTIEAAGLGEDFFLVPPDVLKMAQSRGNAVHVACALIDTEELDWDSVDSRIVGYVRAYEAFRKAMPRIKTISVEKPVWGEVAWRGRIFHIAGTPDFVGFLGNGRRSVIDLKTSQNMTKSMGLQTAGYSLIWNSKYRDQPIYDRYGLRLSKDGSFKLIPHEDPDDMPAFMDALHYAEAKANITRWTEKYH